MSEVRRTTLMPFVGGAGGDPTAVAGGGGGNGDAKKRLSVRLTFVLPESTESTCPVYNYKEELTAARKRDKSKLQNGKAATTTNGLDPFDDDNDDDVKRIAMEMEAKYGTGPPSKRKRKNRRDDYADIGMGYDESDSFIDNTDGYDEMIPQNVTTLHGGFYINCGALEFKADEGVSSDLSSNSSDSSSSSDDEDDDNKDAPPKAADAANKTKPANRKRVLESSDSDEEHEERTTDKTEKAKVKPTTNSAHPVPNGVQQQAKKQRKETLGGDDGKKAMENHKDRPPPKKTPPAVPTGLTTAGSGVEEKKKVIGAQLPPTGATISLVTASGSVGENSVKDKVKNSNLMDVEIMPAERKQSEHLVSNDGAAVSAGSGGGGTGAVLVSVDASAGDNNRDKATKEKDVLPANLPTHISDLIKRIKDNVQKNKDANRDIFHGNVNSLLILFERKSKVLGKQSRSRIYQHFSALMHMEKENLCKRAKSLVMAEDSKRLTTLLADLKARVLVLMVPLWEAHERETIRVTNLKTADTEETKNMRMPKRKFIWTDDTRKMLREIVMVKKRLLIYEGKTKESIEIHLNLFIKSDVQAIWPEGWMTMAALFKLCSSFEKKPVLNNSGQELNSSSEAGMLPPGGVAKSFNNANAAGANPKLKEKKKKVLTKTMSVDVPAKVLSSKDMQKFRTNSVSIIPISTSDGIQPNVQVPQPQKTKPKTTEMPNKDLGEFETPRDMSIIPLAPPAAHKTTIQARSTFKPDKQEPRPPSVDRQTKFVNLPQQTDVSATPENLTKRMSTDYNIDSIIGRKSEPSSTSTSALIAAKRQSTDILIPKEESDDGALSLGGSATGSVTKIPLENFMPKPMVATEVKQEADEDVIILDDNIDDERGASPLVAAAAASRVSNASVEVLRRKPGPKSKTKYVDPALIKSIKSASSVGSAHTSPVEKKSYKPDLAKDKKEPKNDGDDILKLMENLKELNKMTTPSKAAAVAETSPASAVSVIAFNKNFAKSPTQSHSACSSPAAAATTTSTILPSGAQPKTPSGHEMAAAAAAGLTFNDVYQRHFLNSLSTATGAAAATSTPSAPVKTYNSSAHTSTSTAPPDKYYNSNNNYTTAPGQQPTKYKNNFPPHTGTYNLMDDMLANFITEYAYPRTANHKQKPTQK